MIFLALCEQFHNIHHYRQKNQIVFPAIHGTFVSAIAWGQGCPIQDSFEACGAWHQDAGS